jgi:DEAD/DEAH box helicase domain-containing protein
MSATLSLFETYQIEHGRILDIELANGKRLTVRLDQGVGYWHVSPSTNRRVGDFNFYNDPVQQASKLLGLTVNVEGQAMPTQVFVKIR